MAFNYTNPPNNIPDAIQWLIQAIQSLARRINGIGSGGSGGGSGTVTSITAGDGLSGGTITTTGTIAIAPSGITLGTYSLLTVGADGRATAGFFRLLYNEENLLVPSGGSITIATVPIVNKSIYTITAYINILTTGGANSVTYTWTDETLVIATANMIFNAENTGTGTWTKGPIQSGLVSKWSSAPLTIKCAAGSTLTFNLNNISGPDDNVNLVLLIEQKQ